MYVVVSSHCLAGSTCMIANHAILIREEHFYPVDENAAAFLCGPPGLIEKAALPGLEEMGFEDGKTVFGF